MEWEQSVLAVLMAVRKEQYESSLHGQFARHSVLPSASHVCLQTKVLVHGR